MNNRATRTIFAALLLAGAAHVHGQVLAPIAFTFDTTAGETIDQLGLRTDFDSSPITTAGGDVYYMGFQGENPDDLSAGLPDDGTIVSASHTSTTFQLAPSPQPEVLEGSGTVILTTPGFYSHLAFLVNSLASPRAGAPAIFTLNFSDGTSDDTLSTVENVPYWLGGEPGVANGSVALSTEAAFDDEGTPLGDPPTQFDEYDFALSADDAAKKLVSISIHDDSAFLFTYAISGTDPPPDLPEPSTWSLVASGLAGACLLRRLRQAARP